MSEHRGVEHSHPLNNDHLSHEAQVLHCVGPSPFKKMCHTCLPEGQKFGPRLHHRASEMQTFPAPLIGPAPYAVKAFYMHAPSLTDLHLSLERVEGTCPPPPLHLIFEGWGTQYQMFSVSLAHLYYKTHVSHPKPRVLSLLSILEGGGGGGTQCSPVLLTRVSYLVLFTIVYFTVTRCRSATSMASSNDIGNVLPR